MQQNMALLLNSRTLHNLSAPVILWFDLYNHHMRKIIGLNRIQKNEAEFMEQTTLTTIITWNHNYTDETAGWEWGCISLVT